MPRFLVTMVAALLAGAFAMPVPSKAADVPVSYTVDDKILKGAITGTLLTFELYSDGACTNLTHTQAQTIDAVTIVSRLKRFKPKNGIKPPKTAELRTTLSSVTPAAATLKDVNGTTLGPYPNPDTGTVILDDSGTLINGFVVGPSGFFQGVGFFYTSTDCSGQALHIVSSGPFLRNMVGVLGTDLYYFPDSGSSTTVNSQVSGPEIAANCTDPGEQFIPPNRCCCTSPTCFTPITSVFGPVSVMDVSAFVAPFHVEVQ